MRNCVCEIGRDHTFLHVIKLLPRPFPRQFDFNFINFIAWLNRCFVSSSDLVQYMHTHDCAFPSL